MKRWTRGGLAKVLAGMVCAGLAATWATGEILDKREIARRDKHEVALMTESMKTVCVGRMLIDFPGDAEVELAQARIHGFDIATFDEPDEEFQARLTQREAQISARPDRLGGTRNLELAQEVRTKNGLVGKIFVHGRTVTEGTRAAGLELERYRYEGVAVEALVHGSGISIDLSTDDYDPKRLDNITRLVEQLVPNPESRVPTEPGFCLDRAYVRDPLTASQHEQVMLFARLPRHPDIDFMLVLAAGTRPDEEGLLQRGRAAEALLSMAERLRISTLRAAPREIGGLPGEELIRSAVEENDARVYHFWWEVNGTEDSVLVPHIVFRMNTGTGENGPVSSSLTPGAATGLWDKVSSSIRLRPTEPAKVSQTEPDPTALGSYAWAGDTCPHTGWWLCSDGGNGVDVLGGQRQFIKKGDRMPQALLLPPQTLWDKVRGLQPSYESKTRTSWKLIDKRGRQRQLPQLPLAQATPGEAIRSGDAGNGLATAGDRAAPVGSLGSTGSPCSASGWWRCEDPHALDGTRWFAQGSLLPPSTFAVPPTAFGRSTNGPKSIQRRSTWRLMRVASQPESVSPAAIGTGLRVPPKDPT